MIDPRTRRSLVWGHPVVLLGSVALALAGMVIWLLVAGYGLTFSGVRAVNSADTEIQAKVETAGPTVLWTGERVNVVIAVFDYQGQRYRTVGYGDSSLQPQDKVRLALSPSAPQWAVVAGMPRFPISLSTLGRLTLVCSMPGLVLLALGLVLGHRQSMTVRDGRIEPVEVARRIRLFRPLKDKALVRWKREDGSFFWSLSGVLEEEKAHAFVTPRGTVIQEDLLPHATEDAPRRGLSRWRHLNRFAVVLLLAGQLAPLLLFILT